jgi:putative ABC transport system permease protein
MLKNYLKSAVRNFFRQKYIALTNIAGLSIGFICSFFIALWVADELSYDRIHKDGDQIFQVWRHMITDGEIDTYPSLGQPVAETILSDYPEVEKITFAKLDEKFVITASEGSFRERGGYANDNFFEIFSFPFLQGDPATALKNTNSIVITNRVAQRLFGDDWQSSDKAIGKTIVIDHRKEFTVSGVLVDLPHNSSLQFDVLLPARDITDRLGVADDWYYMIFSVYAKVQKGASLEKINEKIADHFIKHDEGTGTKLFMQAFEDVHLYATYRDGQLAGGRIEYIRIFSVVGILLLAIACINFMNLATARSSRRAREIGVRKVVGAQRHALIVQFITESVALAFVSFLIASAMFFPLLPVFNDLTDKHFSIVDLNGSFILSMFGISVVVGILSGTYPALYLSAFNPIAGLRSAVKQGASQFSLRKALVVFQFAISVLMILATVGVYKQLDHLRRINLGVEREGLLFVPREGALREKFEVAAQELLSRPGIAGVTTSGQDPLNIGNNTTGVSWPGKPPESYLVFFIINANYDYTQTMGMQMVAGRDFSRNHTDTHNFIVNESAAQLFGGEVIGKKIKVYGDDGEIVGVVKDFSMNSLYSPIEPVIIRFDPPNGDRLYIGSKAGQTGEALASLRSVCEELNPGYPFEYTFLDQVFEQTYQSEAIMGVLANIFAIIAVFISCLGLLGLTAFAVEQRTKEVGIRKVLGASVAGIAALLSIDFVKLVLFGVLVGLPIAGYAIREWLQGFNSRVTIEWWIFALAGGVAVLLAIATISFQAIRAAVAKPVDTLKTD